VTAVRHNGESFCLRCDVCGVETSPVRYGDPFPIGFDIHGREMQPDGVVFHRCRECQVSGPFERDHHLRHREAS
jgi:hypothetical protein